MILIGRLMKTMPKSPDNPSRRRRMIVGIGIAAVAGCVFAFVLLSLIIGYHVRAAATRAIAEYPGDRVTALMAYASSDDHSLRNRNRAIWALGQLGDKRAAIRGVVLGARRGAGRRRRPWCARRQ